VQDYPLEELGPRAFEQLIVALATQVIGSGIAAFGSGPDGGREATYNGRIEWSATVKNDPGAWDGYTVIQAKQKERVGSPSDNLAWLSKQVAAELDDWFTTGSPRNPVPDYFIFVTNVRLSSRTGGGIDTIDRVIRQKIDEALRGKGEARARARRVRSWKVWHRDQLIAYLNAYAGVRAAFPGMLTAGDLVERMGSVPNLADPAKLQSVLLRHAESGLLAERWVNFSEAGGVSRASLEDVAVDLRYETRGSRDRRIISALVRRSDSVLKDSHWQYTQPRHVVVTGRAGSGKSTSMKFLAQVLRCHFLADERLTASAAELSTKTRAAMDRMEAPWPKNRRWPIRVDLPAYADARGPSGDKDLVRWIAELVSQRAEADIKPFELRSWLNAWPTALLLDGLDEVTSPEVRIRVLDEIRSLVEQLDRADADSLVVITTRPTGYTEKILPEQFVQVDLSLLSSTEALAYGRLVTERRLAEEPDRRDQVITKLKALPPNSAQGRLMGTPLQVLIMTLILERFGVLPPDRYQLFARYFDTVFDRESAKSTTLQRLLTEHKRAVVEVHELAGLELQRESETTSHARALLTQERLRELALKTLASIGFDREDGLPRIADQIVQAATERLVLLVPSEDDCLSFEVRSLQELMAANALFRHPDDTLERNLSATAHSPHWRNTWVFTAGKAFAEGSHERRELVVRVVERADAVGDWPGWLCPSGPELAGELLADGMSHSAPKWQSRLLDVALRALTGPLPVELGAIGAGLRAVESTPRAAVVVSNALRDAREGTPRARAAASTLDEILGERSDERTAFDDDWDDDWERISLADILQPHLAGAGYLRGADEQVDAALKECHEVFFEKGDNGVPVASRAAWHTSMPRFADALIDPVASETLRGILGSIGPALWFVERTVARIARSTLSRRPALIVEESQGGEG